MKDKKDQLAKLLDGALAGNLSEADRGEIYTNFALLYLRSVNSINKQYEKILDDAIAVLKSIKAKEAAL